MLKRFTLLSCLLFLWNIGFSQTNYVETNFTGGLPEGWILQNGSSYYGTGWEYRDGDNEHLFIDCDWDMYVESYFISPALSMTDGAKVNFDLKKDVSSANFFIDICISKTDQELSSFNLLKTIDYNESNENWISSEINIKELTDVNNDDVYYIAFKIRKPDVYYQTNVSIDNISIGSRPVNPLAKINTDNISMTCEVGIETTAYNSLTLSNEGQNPLTISSVTDLSSTEFSTTLPTDISSITLNAGEKLPFSVSFTGTEAGTKVQTLEMVTNGGTINISLNAEFIEKVTATPSFYLDFETAIPNTFTIIDNNNDGVTWKSGEERAFEGTKSAISSRTNTSGIANDEWLISSKVTVKAESQLKFVALRSITASGFDENLNIYVSKAGRNIKHNFNIIVDKDIDLKSSYKEFIYNIDEIEGINAGDEIYIGIQHFTKIPVEGNYISIDKLRFKDPEGLNDEAEILGCSYQNQHGTFKIDGSNIKGMVKSSVDLSNIDLDFELSRNAKITSEKPTDFSSEPKPVTITSEDNTLSKQYTIEITKATEATESFVENIDDSNIFPIGWIQEFGNNNSEKWGIAHDGKSTSCLRIEKNSSFENDSYLISPQLIVGEDSKIALWYKSDNNDPSIELLISKTDVNIEDFSYSVDNIDNEGNNGKWIKRYYSVNGIEGINSGDKIYFAIRAKGKYKSSFSIDEFEFGDLDVETKITSFTFDKISGSAIINEENKTISASGEYDIDLTKITPNIEVSSGASVSPEGEMNFKDTEVTYTVSCLDQSSQYTVTIDRIKNSDALISKFKLDNEFKTAYIKNNGDNEDGEISLYFPENTSLIALTPEIEFSFGATVSPASGETRDFTNPVTYTVTSEDGITSKKYIVTAHVDGDVYESLTESFDINSVPGFWSTLNANNDGKEWQSNTDGYKGRALSIFFTASNHDDYIISPKLKVGSKSLLSFWTKATWQTESYKALISKAGKNPEDFTIELENVQFSNEGEFVKDKWHRRVFDLNKVEGINEGDEIYFAFKATGANGYFLFFDEFEYGALDLDAKILSFTFDGISGNAVIDHEALTVKADAKPSTNISAITPTIEVSNGATYSPEGAQDFTTPVEYQVENPIASSTYTVTITRLKGENALIKEFTAENQISCYIKHNDDNDGAIKLLLPSNINLSSVVPTIKTSVGATISSASGVAIDLSSPFTYTVTSEDKATTKKYIVTAIVEGEGKEELTENFDSSEIPEFWTVNNLNNDDQTWHTTPESNHNEGGSRGFYIKSKYQKTNDDLLISPKLKVQEGSNISFYINANNFKDSYKVLLSKTGRNPEDFTIELENVTSNTYADKWKKKIYELDKIADVGIGDKIYLAIKATSTSATGIYFDEFKYGIFDIETKITDISFNELIKETLVIDQENHTITGKVTKECDLVKIYPNFTFSEGTSISPENLSGIDFSQGPVEFTVSFNDHKTVYSVSLTTIILSDAEITSFSFDGQVNSTVIETEKAKVKAKAEDNSDISAIVPTIEVSEYATIEPASGVVQNFANGPVIYTVTAEDGTKKIWEVSITNGDIAFEGITEDFEGEDIPEFWTIIDNDGDGKTWKLSETAEHTGEQGIKSQGSGDTKQDNWLISPKIKVRDKDQLSFFARSSTSLKLEDFNIKVSTTGKEVNNFDITLEEIKDATSTYQEYVYRLDEIENVNAGDDIYIGIQVVSQNKLELYLDDFSISIASDEPMVDLVLSSDVPEYVLTPVNQSNFTFFSRVENNGNKILTDETSVTWKVENTDYSHSYNLNIPFNFGEFQTFEANTKPFVAIEKGEYTVNISLSNTVDADLTNNTVSYNFIVSDTVLAREDGAPNGIFSLDDGVTGIFGQEFELVNDDYLSSVSTYIAEPVIGNKIKAQVREFSFMNGPGKLIFESDEYEIKATESGFVHIEVPNGLKLKAGSYFIGIQNSDSKITKIATTDKYYKAATAYISDGQKWAKVETTPGNTNVAFLIRANLNTKVGINNITNIDFNILPNPIKDFAVIKSNENAKVIIYDNIGNVVYICKVFKGDNKINLSQLSSGSYIIQLINENKQSTQKLIVQ
ncbi:MAG: choice-of-anchor J domain-containing protein [Hyphomicrobiales bacterium]